MKPDPDDLAFLAGLRVLYVEDEADTRHEVARFLSRRVGALEVARDGREGLESFRSHPHDLVLTDIHMPAMDGLSLARAIRTTHPRLPIVVATAFDRVDYLVEAIEIGISHYVLKPIDSDRLEAALAQVAHCIRGAQLVEQERQLELERLRLQHHEAMAVLAGGLAHDFSNLLQAMLGVVSTARMVAEPGSTTATLLGKAEAYSGQAQTLMGRLRALADRDPLREDRGPLRPLLEAACREALAESPIEVRWDFQEATPHPAFHAGHLRQAFNHLLTNAREAMPAGGVLTLSCRAEYPPQGAPPVLHLSFRDTGCGMAPDLLARAFDPYVSTKDAPGTKGLGLSLAFARAIAQNHGGTLTAESRPGEGSTFHFRIPLPASTHCRVPKPAPQDLP